MELLIGALPRLPIGFRLRLDQLFDLRQLVIGADDARLPVEVGSSDRPLERMTFEELPHLGYLAQVLDRDRQNREALLPFGDDEPVGSQSRQGLAQRVDA